MLVSCKRKETEQHAFVLHILKTITTNHRPAISFFQRNRNENMNQTPAKRSPQLKSTSLVFLLSSPDKTMFISKKILLCNIQDMETLSKGVEGSRFIMTREKEKNTQL